MLPGLRRKTGTYVMALWQFTTFTVLIGAIIVYAAIITRRLSLADDRLTRMEEALLFLARSGSVNAGNAVNPDAPTIEAKPEISEIFEKPEEPVKSAALAVPELPEMSAKPQVSAEEEARRVYLTMRDLRARSELRASRPSRPTPVAAPVPEAHEALKTTPEPTQPTPPTPSPDTTPAREDAVVAIHHSEAVDAPATSSEPPVTNTELQSSPDDHSDTDAAATDDAAAKKTQEILVFLNAQRRRRRARMGY
jgi:hypothetical protein